MQCYILVIFLQIVFQMLLQNINEICNMNVISKIYVPMELQLMVTLWLLGTPDSFRSVGNRFKMNKGTAHFIYKQTIKNICKLSSQYINWLNNTELQTMKNKIQSKTGFQNVCGMIDGTHINIKAPEQSVRYYNKKKNNFYGASSNL